MAEEASASGEEEVHYVYKMYAMLVQKYVEARNRDILPDIDSEKILGMSGTVGRTLYGAFKTFQLQGRFSRTQIEQALATDYPTYIQLWLRSLPPAQRSRYAADLYNSDFRGIEWDTDFHTNPHAMMQQDGFRPIPPPVPVGDDRHSARMAHVVKVADDFHALLNTGILFQGIRAGDVEAGFSSEYVDMMDGDILQEYGSVFGIQKSELHFGVRSDASAAVLSNSDIVLRAWNVLYFSERLSKTELEHALIQGPGGMSSLLKTGVKLASQLFCNPKHSHLLNLALPLVHNVVFTALPDDASDQRLECDYCGEAMEKTLLCAKCKVAMYCGRECQRGDWKRHKPLCSRYQETKK